MVKHSNQIKSKVTKPDFSQIFYDPHNCCWGMGNNVFGPATLAIITLPHIRTQEMDDAEEDNKIVASAQREIFNG